MIAPTNVENAYRKIKNDLVETPLVFCPELSAMSGAEVYLKMEQMQHTGSFKIRGVLNKIQSIDKADFNKPFVAASTGNHAAAFGLASQKFNFKGILFLPKKTSKAKLKAIEHFDIEKIFYGDNSMETEAKATAYAKEVDGVLIHPYNDLHIITGQGTLGVEIRKQLPTVDSILVPIGGGGLASGICSYFSEGEKVETIGCQPNNASEMCDSIKQGAIVRPSTLQTIADAAAGGIEAGSATFTICKNLISRFEIVDEEAIKKAVAFVMKYHLKIIEPTAALPIAALLNSAKYKGKNVVLVLTGKKINEQLLTEIIDQYGDYY